MSYKKGINQIKILEILNKDFFAFETDERLFKLFSYYLHKAPNIDSRTARNIEKDEVEVIWNLLLKEVLSNYRYKFYKNYLIKDNQLKKYKLDNDSIVNKNKKMFICTKKDKEHELNCLTRHLRNSIAHNRVYVLTKKRKYILFDDYSPGGNHTARLLFNQTDLKRMKEILQK